MGSGTERGANGYQMTCSLFIINKLIQKSNFNSSNTKIMTIVSFDYLILLVSRLWSENIGFMSQKGLHNGLYIGFIIGKDR
jgi:hypothetical protein